MQASTTFPPKPVGQIAPEVPLGESAQLDETNQPIDDPKLQDSGIDMTQWVMIDKFTISKTMSPGVFLWKWDSRTPLGQKFYNTYEPVMSTVKMRVPRSMKWVYFAQFANIEWELKFDPVKATDARAQISITQNFYGDDSAVNLDLTKDKNSFLNEMELRTFDSPDQQIQFTPRLFQPQSKLANSDGFQHSLETAPQKQWPLYTPCTVVKVNLKSKYLVNAAQPPDFEVNVFVRPKINVMSQLISRSLCTSPLDDTFVALDYIPMPWWLHRQPVDYLEILHMKTTKRCSRSYQMLIDTIKAMFLSGSTREVILTKIKQQFHAPRA